MCEIKNNCKRLLLNIKKCEQSITIDGYTDAGIIGYFLKIPFKKSHTKRFLQIESDIKNIKIYNKTELVLARFGLLPSLLEPFYGIILSESSCFRLSGKAVWVYPAPPAAGLKNRHVPVGHLHMERRQNRGRAGSRGRCPRYCSGPYRPGFRCAVLTGVPLFAGWTHKQRLRPNANPPVTG